MIDALKELLKLPYRVLALILGVLLVTFPIVTIDKEYHWTTHPPTTLIPVWIGVALLILSVGSFLHTLFSKPSKGVGDVGAGLDLTRVKESNGAVWTTIGGCEIHVIKGRIEEQTVKAGVAIALPCNEYFDDRCAGDIRSALGAYVNRVFERQVDEFILAIKDACRKKLGAGVEQKKTDDEWAESFGAGKCVLLTRPLGQFAPVALVSTTTQRAGQGLSARISYLFDGMRELFRLLADARLNEVIMPVLGAGHGGIDPPLAFVGLLLAVAEAARYGQGGQRLKKVTIVVFKRDADSQPEVDDVIVRRALALIGSRD